MTEERIARLNALAQLKKQRELTVEELAEQAEQAAAKGEAAGQRAEVRAGRASKKKERERGYTPSDEVTAAQAYRDRTTVVDPDGTRKKLERKAPQA